MKSENQRTQSPGLITVVLAAIICFVVVATEFIVKHAWKGFVWLMKQLFTKSPGALRGIWRATTWTGKSLKNVIPARKTIVLPTPEIFRNEAVAPARAFSMRELNRLK